MSHVLFIHLLLPIPTYTSQGTRIQVQQPRRSVLVNSFGSSRLARISSIPLFPTSEQGRQGRPIPLYHCAETILPPAARSCLAGVIYSPSSCWTLCCTQPSPVVRHPRPLRTWTWFNLECTRILVPSWRTHLQISINLFSYRHARMQIIESDTNKRVTIEFNLTSTPFSNPGAIGQRASILAPRRCGHCWPISFLHPKPLH